MLNITNYITQGQRNTIKLQKDLSFKNPWIQVHNNTTIDQWHVGDFSSASYFVTVEYDSNSKETMQILVVARPGQATLSIFGRTTIQDPLVTLTATVTNSILTMAATANTGYTGAKLTYVASYIETIQPLTTPTIVPSVPSGTAVISPLVPTPTSFGIVNSAGQPTLTAGAAGDTLTFIAGSGIGLTTNASSNSLTISSSFPFYSNIQVTGQTTLVPTSPTSNLTFTPANGITLTTNGTTNTITVGIGTVPGLTSSSTITAPLFSGSGASLTSLNASNLVTGTVSSSLLPIATTNNLGAIKVDGSSITINNSVISATQYTLPSASTSSLGGVIIPTVTTSGITNSSGTIGLATASTTQLGGVLVDGTSISINNGVISNNGTALTSTTANSTYFLGLQPNSSGYTNTTTVSPSNLYFNPYIGTLYTTLFQSLSDETQKTNITPIVNATEIIKQLGGFEFNWKDNGIKSAGTIAQIVEKILPWLVSESNGLKSVNYDGIIGYLIESNKELAARLDALENK